MWKRSRFQYCICSRTGFSPLSVRSTGEYYSKLIALSRYLKGVTTLGEMLTFPNKLIHVIYKDYVETMNDKEKQEQYAATQGMEEMEEAFNSPVPPS